jgi:uncharacterized protein (DUF58 family)
MWRFDDRFLTKLEYLRIVSRRAFAGRDRADRLSRKRGRGLEFADYRPYAHGDDVRHIDWKAYKRLNRLLLRLFDEEQDLSIYLFLDVSASMSNHGKFDQARRIAAALCYIGLVHMDRISILPFGARLLPETVPGRGRSRIFPVFAALDRLTSHGHTDLAHSFRQFASRARQRGLAIVISDFLDPSGFEAGLKMLASTRHDVCAIHILSERDARVDVGGEVRAVDAESGESRNVDITPGLAASYAKAWHDHAEAVETFCRRFQIAYVRAAAEDPFEDVMLRAFREAGFVA